MKKHAKKQESALEFIRMMGVDFRRRRDKSQVLADEVHIFRPGEQAEKIKVVERGGM